MPRGGAHTKGGVDTPRCCECLLPFWLSSCGPWGLVRFAAHQRWLVSLRLSVGVCRERGVASGLVWSVRATGLVTGLGRDVGGWLLIPVLQRRLPPCGPWGLGRHSTDPQVCFKEMRLAGGGLSRRGAGGSVGFRQRATGWVTRPLAPWGPVSELAGAGVALALALLAPLSLCLPCRWLCPPLLVLSPCGPWGLGRYLDKPAWAGG